MEASERQNTVFELFSEAINKKVLHQFADDSELDGKHFTLAGRELISFASCSYLGLETDPRLREGVHRAVERYGTQFSASRAYISGPLYAELEDCLSQIFDAYVLPTSTTTLGHLSAIPVICGEKDLILIDQMVHHSVQLAVTQARSQGSTVKLVRHNDWHSLEELLSSQSLNYRKVWFMIDGVYSMLGDLPDVFEIRRLLEAYPNLHLYVDDAHGMSIAGKHGQGMHLSRMGWHPRMVLAVSLNKAFASAGGCLVFKDRELRDRVRLCGGPYTFGGPVQPPMLGAAVASAKLHLSDDITAMQKDLLEKIKFLNGEFQRHNVPTYEQNHTPIFFVKCGPLIAMHGLLARLRTDGYFISAGMYPAVSLRYSGARISITRHHTKEDLAGLAAAVARHYPAALADAGMKQEEVEPLFAFKNKVVERQRKARLARVFEVADTPERQVTAPTVVRASTGLTLDYGKSIHHFDPNEWDRMLGARSTLNHSSLASLEATFRERPEPESNWGWHYFVVRAGQTVVASTFFTDALWKDDMMMREEVSVRIEALRTKDPYFLTSRVMAMGSLLTEGNHLYLDRSGPWQEALAMIIDDASKRQREVGATNLVVRDLPDDDAEVGSVLLELGLVKMPMLDSFSAAHFSQWSNEDEFLTMLRSRTRRNRTQKRVKAEVHDQQQHFTIKLWRKGVDPEPTASDIAWYHQLYQNLKTRKRRLNTFDLPTDIFSRLWSAPGWELMSLHLSPAAGGRDDGKAVAVVASFVGDGRMVALICGLDGAPREISVYRQMLWQLVSRAKQTGVTTLELGMDAEQEKLRIGCEPRKQCAYFQLTDHFSAELIDQVFQSISLGEAAPTATSTSSSSELS